MRIIKPSVELIRMTENPLGLIEYAGRKCYQSKADGELSCEPFVKQLMTRGHYSVIEHASATFNIVCDRGVTHEIVRHRLASYSQESTRYCNYAREKFGSEIKVIEPPNVDYAIWESAMKSAEFAYLAMVNQGIKPQMARSVLPTCLKTEIVMTANFREWLHFLTLRCAPAAHPQMCQIANMIYVTLNFHCPVIFNDENIISLAEKLKHAEAALRIAVGLVSTLPQFAGQHPDQVLETIRNIERETRD